MSDQTTTLAALKSLVAGFVKERDWNQFHSPKNLSMSIAIEAAELMEHFQWLTIDQSRAIGADSEKVAAAAEELSDIMCYSLALANELKIDLADSIRSKMLKNVIKYPAAEFRGRYGHGDTGQ
jgi:NTP pyrophosphatase (non-canonical NTP hydrolase)